MPFEESDFKKVREFAREQADRAAEYKMQVKFLNKENARLRRRLDRVYQSWTWRIGRVVLFPYYAIVSVVERVRRHQFQA